jgi:diaphanous 1
MPEASLIVPTVLLDGSLQFSEIRPNGTAQDVVDFLLANEDLKSEILGDLTEHGWALQRIRSENSGRTWEVEELEALGDGSFVQFATCNRRH